MSTHHTRFGTGFNACFIWAIDETDPQRRYWIHGLDQFCGFGLAVVDDFGNLVKVPR